MFILLLWLNKGLYGPARLKAGKPSEKTILSLIIFYFKIWWGWIGNIGFFHFLLHLAFVSLATSNPFLRLCLSFTTPLPLPSLNADIGRPVPAPTVGQQING